MLKLYTVGLNNILFLYYINIFFFRHVFVCAPFFCHVLNTLHDQLTRQDLSVLKLKAVIFIYDF